MMTWFTDRNHAREHSGPYRDNEMQAMKGYDDVHGLACLLDGHWGSSVEHMPNLGCHFGYNSFLDYGAEFLCSDFEAIREVWAFSGSVEKKFVDADWNWVLYQQQASFKNSSTFLDSIDGFEGGKARILKSDVKVAPDPSFSCAASKTPFCHHARRNRPRRVHMLSAPGSNSASLVSQRDSVLYYSFRGQACIKSPPCRSFLTRNEDWVVKKGQDAPSRWINARSSPCIDRLCLASLICDDRSTSVETKLFDFLSPPTGLTDLIPVSECHLGTTLESVSTISNRFNDKKIDLKVSEKKSFVETDEDIEMLGKALCHAQTRARLAEKLAEQTLQENKRLEQLLIREAWTTYTYKQRALALELENELLKLHSKLGPGVLAGKGNACISNAAELRTRALWKLAEKQFPYKSGKILHTFHSSQAKRSKSRKQVSLSSTVGFAFLLGLSVAGAGIAIVWIFF